MSTETSATSEPATKPPRRWRYRGDLWDVNDPGSALLVCWFVLLAWFCTGLGFAFVLWDWPRPAVILRAVFLLSALLGAWCLAFVRMRKVDVDDTPR